jgi:uncharacterized protein YukE
VGGYGDALALEQQDKLGQQQAASNARLYNADGSAKANDYHPPKLPESAFPAGLTADKELTVNRDQLTAVATQMHADLVKLQATLQQLNGSGAGGETIGGWPTADALGNNAGSAYWGISQFYQSLNTAYDNVISYLRQTASNYADAESSTASAARGVGTESSAGRGAMGA